MGLKLRTPGGERTWIAAILIIASLFALAKNLYTGSNSSLGWAVAGFFLLGGTGLWFKQQWARWALIVFFLAGAGYFGFVLVSKGFNIKWLLWVGFSLYSSWLIWKHFSPAKIEEAAAENRPMISLVLLLREPRYLEAKVLANIVSSAWGANYSGEEGDDNAERFVVGESPLFIINGSEGLFVVNNFPVPYFDNMDAVLEETKELHLRKALEDHNAWLSVDLMRMHDENASIETAYRQIAKLIAELSGPDCLAILQPATSKINVWDAELEEKLRGPNPLEEFAEPTRLPVVQVADDDPRMKAAVAEARSSWSQFVEAFKKRDGENFSIKAPITANDRTEFIWVEVNGLEPEYIHGTLGNDPVDLGDLKFGSRVEVPLKDLNDWAFIRNGEPVGMFTVKVLEKIYGKG